MKPRWACQLGVAVGIVVGAFLFFWFWWFLAGFTEPKNAMDRVMTAIGIASVSVIGIGFALMIGDAVWRAAGGICRHFDL